MWHPFGSELTILARPGGGAPGAAGGRDPCDLVVAVVGGVAPGVRLVVGRGCGGGVVWERSTVVVVTSRGRKKRKRGKGKETDLGLSIYLSRFWRYETPLALQTAGKIVTPFGISSSFLVVVVGRCRSRWLCFRYTPQRSDPYLQSIIHSSTMIITCISPTTQ